MERGERQRCRADGGLRLQPAGVSLGTFLLVSDDITLDAYSIYVYCRLFVCRNAGAWTEKEACAIYREKLLALRSLYTSQLARLKHSLAERRRQFLLEWAAAGGDREEGKQYINYTAEQPHNKKIVFRVSPAVNPSHGGSLEDAAYRSYRRRTGEEAVLERRQKQRQIAASIEFFSRKEMRSSSRGHHQHLVRLQGQYMPTPHPVCNNLNCENKCLPFSMKCRRRIPILQVYTLFCGTFHHLVCT